MFSPASFVDVYVRCYQRVYDRRPSSWSVRDSVAGPVEALCRNFGIDLETYIVANMRMMAHQGAKYKFAFKPTFLLGDKAVGRYQTYVGHLSNRYRHAHGRVEKADHPRDAWLVRYMLAEAEFGGEYMGDMMSRSDVVSEDEYLEGREVDSWWLSERSGQRYGDDHQVVHRVALLRAAVRVLNGLSPGFAAQASFTRFSWPLAALLMKLKHPGCAVPRRTLRLAGEWSRPYASNDYTTG